MSRALLVAWRDYRQLAGLRGFWIMLLSLPVAIAVTLLATRFVGTEANAAYAIADVSGRYAPAIEQRLERDYQRRLEGDLADYARHWNIPLPEMLRARGGDAQVTAFIARGGVAAGLHQIRLHLPPGAPAFTPSPRPFVRVPLPAAVPTDKGPGAFGVALAPSLKGYVATPDGKRPLVLAVYIPAHFGQAAARIWTDGRGHDDLLDTIRAELTRLLQLDALRAHGVAEGEAARIQTLEAPLDIVEARGGRAGAIIRSAVPLALVYILLMAAMVTGSMMLQGVIEERSNRLLESLLACIRPSELMFGKLIGLGAMGLTIIAVWMACALGAVLAMQGGLADFLRPSLMALERPWMIGALLFYFLAGYLIIAMAFLAIGSLSNSMQDSSAYLTPVILTIMLPVVLMMSSVLRNPDGPFPRILSWIPVYTPFAMLARLGSGVSLPEVLGTAVLVIAFLALELFLLGRLFQANLLNTGQPPKLAALYQQIFPPPAS